MLSIKVFGRSLVLFAILVSFANSFATEPANNPQGTIIEREQALDSSQDESKVMEEFAKSMIDQYPGRKTYLIKMRFYETNARAVEKEAEQLPITRTTLWTPQDATFSFLSSSEVPLSKTRSKIHAAKEHSLGLILNGIIADNGQGKICIKTKTIAVKIIDGRPSSLRLPDDTKEVLTNAKLNEPAKFQLIIGNKGEILSWWCEAIVTEVVK